EHHVSRRACRGADRVRAVPQGNRLHAAPMGRSAVQPEALDRISARRTFRRARTTRRTRDRRARVLSRVAHSIGPPALRRSAPVRKRLVIVERAGGGLVNRLLGLLVCLVLVHGSSGAEAQASETFKARLSPLPRDATNTADLTGVGTVTAVLV